MRVLILADQCNPEWPSLPIVGYKAAKAIANHADVTVVTQVRNKPNIEKHGFGNAKVDYVNTEYIASPIHKFMNLIRGSEGGWTTVMAFDYPTYLCFEWEVWKKYNDAIKKGEYDVVHRITPMSPTLASFMAKRCPVPFITGPLNGGLKWPKAFIEEMRREKEWLSPFRDFYKVLPYNRSTYHKSSAILASFEHTMVQVPEKDRDRAFDFPEIGIDPELFNIDLPRVERPKKKILYAGRLVPYKLPEMVIHAFANSDILKNHELIIAGDGPLKEPMEKIAKEHGLDEVVQFVGWKTQKEIGEYMRDCEIFAFPSVRELGAGVVVEALACGMACAVLNYGAPGTLVDDTCGKRVEIGSKEAVQNGFTQALEELVEDDKLLEYCSNAHERAIKLFSWDVKAKKSLEIYEWTLGQRKEKPDFWQ